MSGFDCDVTYQGDLRKAKENLEEGVSQKEKNETLLEASNRGFYSLVKLLVKNGADVNFLSSGSTASTPLHDASAKHYTRGKERSLSKILIILFLFIKGAKIRTKNWQNDTPLGTAFYYKSFLAIPILLILYILSFIIPAQYRTKVVDPCPSCGKRMKTRERIEQITKMINATQGYQRDVTLYEQYCPKCGHVENSDLYNDLERARSEMANR